MNEVPDTKVQAREMRHVVNGAAKTVTKLAKKFRKVAFLGKIETFFFRAAVMVAGLTSSLSNAPRQIGYKHAATINDSAENVRQAIRRASVCSIELGTFNAGVGSAEQLTYVGKALAMPAVFGGSGPQRWVMDTGSGNDLVGKQDLNAAVMRDAEKFSPPMILATANGHIVVDDEVDLQVAKLKLVVRPKVLLNTPAVLSIGKRCMEDGFDFVWRRRELPQLVHPDGTVTVMPLDNLVPYLEEETGNRNSPIALPGIEVGGSSGSGEPIAVQEVVVPEALVQPGALDVLAMTGDQRLKAIAESPEHALTHLPKNAFCKACQSAKAYKKQARRRDPETRVRAAAFGDLVMADHMVVMKDSEEGVSGEKAALMIYDEGTDYRELVGVQSKSAHHAELALKAFVGEGSVKTFYSDNSKELKRAARNLEWVHATGILRTGRRAMARLSES